MSRSDQTADDFFATLNGFDELAIVKHYGTPIHQLHPNSGGSPFVFLRALAFIHLRRHDTSDRDAYKQSMDLTVTESQEYFADPEPDLDPDDPDTPAGKDDSPSG
jgi:hypothetical protein